MATILVVDDRPLNREFLVTLLSYYDHTLIEAADGIEALLRVSEQRPDLVITDLLMPNMDGEELTRRLRADAATQDLPIIFYTATYRAREARQIANRVGVRQVLAKPSEPSVIMAAVADALGIAAPPEPEQRENGASADDLEAPFERGADQRLHTVQSLNLRLAKLLEGALKITAEQARSLAAEHVSESALLDMQSLSLRLTGMIEMGLELASERDPIALVELFCRAIQDMLSARYTGVVMLAADGRSLRQFATRGLGAEVRAEVEAAIMACPAAQRALIERRSTRLVRIADEDAVTGLPLAHPQVGNFMASPLVAHGETIGWMYVAERLGDVSFMVDDERIATALAAQFATAWESLALYGELDRRVGERTAQLQAASQAKDVFLSSMSHELRTPLNAILGFAQLLEADSSNLSQRTENIEQIQKAGWHLLELINEVLDLAKIETGAIRLSMEGIELREVIAEILQLIDPVASQYQIAIAAEAIQSCTHHIRADRTRLRQVLLNLLSNAIKYNRIGGSVTLAIGASASDKVRIEVADTGSGLTHLQQTHLFEAFNRLGRENENIEGTGIGLVITRRLVEAMGGTIGVTSAAGEGSTFWVEFALAPIASAVAPHPHDQDIDADIVAAPSRICKLLYVEDNPVNLLLVSKIVATQPCLIMLSANSGAQGLEIARTQCPDIILLDIELPDMSGLDVLRQLQRDKRTSAIPVLALSAHAAHHSIAAALAAGFKHYITKPIRVKAFLDTVYRSIEN